MCVTTPLDFIFFKEETLPSNREPLQEQSGPFVRSMGQLSIFLCRVNLRLKNL